MTSALPSLRDLFVGDLRTASAPALGALATLVDGVHWKALCEHALDVLDLNVVDLLIGGWRRHAEVRSQLRATALDPSRTALVHVAAHTVESSHKPKVEVRAEGRLLAILTVPVEIAFEIEAVELSIRAGEIREIRPGRVMVRGIVKIENSVVLERELKRLEFPGRIVIDPAEPARPRAAACG